MESFWLPIIFAVITGVSILAYAILDGYDLGIGILLPVSKNQNEHRNTMIASIGPFWDANETWLVLAVGLLLIAFPAAHSYIMLQLYLPVVFMLAGLILRGVAFDFRAKAIVHHQYFWDMCFKVGSIITSLCQGYMMGQFIIGFNYSLEGLLFSLITAIGVTAAYAYIGGAWLVLKTTGFLQVLAARWALTTGRIAFIGVLAICIVNPWVNPAVYDRWFQMPLAMFVLLLPVLCVTLFVVNDLVLKTLPRTNDELCGIPFLLAIGIFITCFIGLCFSFMPDIIPGKMTIWEAASAPASLSFILSGAVVVIPIIVAYTIFSYHVFKGKASDLKYY